MDIQEIIRYHQKKANYHEEQNKNFRNMAKWQKSNHYKELYDKQVRMHREKLKWHTEAIKALKELIK